MQGSPDIRRLRPSDAGVASEAPRTAPSPHRTYVTATAVSAVGSAQHPKSRRAASVGKHRRLFLLAQGTLVTGALRLFLLAQGTLVTGALRRRARYGSLTARQGIIFFIAHPFLYPLLKARLLPAFLLSAFIILNLFFWTYLPQVAFLALFQRNGSAWVNGTFLVLGEGAAVTALLFESFLAVRALLSPGDEN
jgi:hypothetical protein